MERSGVVFTTARPVTIRIVHYGGTSTPTLVIGHEVDPARLDELLAQ